MILRAWVEGQTKQAIQQALASFPCTLDIQDYHPIDYQQQYMDSVVPLQIGPFRISPPWHAAPSDIIIEPGIGFGTGEHTSTRQMLVAMAKLGPSDGPAWDIGCGSGILAIAAAKQLGIDTDGVDVQASAITAAKHNAALNNVSCDFSTKTVDELAPRPLVFGNLHAELIVSLSQHLRRLCGQRLWLAGILAKKETMVLDKFPSWRIDHRLQDGEWVHLQLRVP